MGESEHREMHHCKHEMMTQRKAPRAEGRDWSKSFQEHQRLPAHHLGEQNETDSSLQLSEGTHPVIFVSDF